MEQLWFYLQPVQLVRGFFVLSSVAALSVNAVPVLRERFLLYGSRQSIQTNRNASRNRGNSLAILDTAAKLQVPHSWFIHFYVASIASSLFWAHQILTDGIALRTLADLTSSLGAKSASSMTFNQIAITWGLMFCQGLRRFYECLVLGKPSASKMPFISWLLGIAFYLAVGISVWIEGFPMLQTGKTGLHSLKFSAPSSNTMLAVPIFFLGSGVQHHCHSYLANLKKYTLPSQTIFRWVLCPHYTSECIIYLALSLASAPTGQAVNLTMTTALMFTFVNLALTAETTREWYATKFGSEAVKGRWRIIPYLF